MLYFDHAATGGYKPERVTNAVVACIKACANPGRSGHRLSLALAERVFACRETLCDFFGGDCADRVIFTKNCTEALNLATFGVLQKGDHVVTTCLEHNSVLRPLEALKRAKIIEYDVAPLSGGKLNVKAIAALVTKKTRAVYVTMASNVTGEAPDIPLLKSLLPKRVLLACDGAQAAGHLPVCMKKAGIDLLAISGHKGMNAIQGAGALIFSRRVNPRPVLFGGTGSESRSLLMPTFYPDRLESGTLSYPAIVSLFEGTLYLRTRQAEISKKLFSLTKTLCERLSLLRGITLYSAPNACGIVSFSYNLPSEQCAQLLSERYDIAVRGGLHCAPLAHKALGTDVEGLVRVSFGEEHTQMDIQTLVDALGEITTL